jgi:hypothetical protein
MPDSGYTNTLTLHEFSCKKGWRAKTAEPEKPVEEPEGTPMLFGYPVHTNHDWTPDMAAGITFGPPMIAAPKETPYLDALQKRYLEALKRMQVDQSQVKTLNVDSSSIDPGVTASLVILDEAAKMPDWVWERNEFKKPSEVDPNSFSSEELPSAVQHLLPPGEDGTLGGYLVPPAYQQAILRHFQDQQEMQGVSLLDPRRRQHKTIYGTAGRLMIRHTDDEEWQQIGKDVSFSYDVAAPEGDSTAYTVSAIEYVRPGTAFTVEAEIDAELYEKFRKILHAHLTRTMEHEIDRQFLYGNPLAPTKPLKWEDVEKVVRELGSKRSTPIQRFGDWSTNGFEQPRPRPQARQGVRVPSYHEEPSCELDRIYIKGQGYFEPSPYLCDDDMYSPRMIRHREYEGILQLEEHDPRFNNLVSAYEENRQVVVSYLGQFYYATVKFVEMESMMRNMYEPTRAWYNFTFFVEYSPRRVEWHLPRGNPFL